MRLDVGQDRTTKDEDVDGDGDGDADIILLGDCLQ